MKLNSSTPFYVSVSIEDFVDFRNDQFHRRKKISVQPPLRKTMLLQTGQGIAKNMLSSQFSV
jgi:hypothetical protein